MSRGAELLVEQPRDDKQQPHHGRPDPRTRDVEFILWLDIVQMDGPFFARCRAASESTVNAA